MGTFIGSILGAIAGLAGTFAVLVFTPVGFGVCEHGCSLGVFFLVGAGAGAALGAALGSLAGSSPPTRDTSKQP